MKSMDLTQVYEKYKGLWVAFTGCHNESCVKVCRKQEVMNARHAHHASMI